MRVSMQPGLAARKRIEPEAVPGGVLDQHGIVGLEDHGGASGGVQFADLFEPGAVAAKAREARPPDGAAGWLREKTEVQIREQIPKPQLGVAL